MDSLWDVLPVAEDQESPPEVGELWAVYGEDDVGPSYEESSAFPYVKTFVVASVSPGLTDESRFINGWLHWSPSNHQVLHRRLRRAA